MVANALNAEIIISAVDHASKVFGGIAKNAQGLSAGMQRAGANLVKAGAVMTGAVTAPVLAYAAASVQAADQFQRQAVELRKELSDVSAEKFEEITAALRAIPRNLPVDLAEVMATATQAREFGIAAEDVNRFTEATAKFSLAIGEQMGATGQSLATLGKAYGLTTDGIIRTADAVQHYADVMNSSEKDVLAYTQAIGPSAHALGISAENAAAFGASLMSQGVEAGDAATRVETLYKKIASGRGFKAAVRFSGMSSKAFKKAFGEDANAAILLVLENIAKLGTLQEQQAALASMVGEKQAAGLLPLLRMIGDVRREQEAVAQGAAAGAVDAKTAEQIKSYASNVRMLQNTLGDLQITTGNIILPQITPWIEGMNKAINDLASTPEGQGRIDLIAKLGLGAAAVGPLMVAAGGIIWSLGKMAGAIRAVAAAAVLVASPVGIAAAAITALGASVAYAAYQSWPKIESGLQTIATQASIARQEASGLAKALMDLNGPEIAKRAQGTADAVGNMKDQGFLIGNTVIAQWFRNMGLDSVGEMYDGIVRSGRERLMAERSNRLMNEEVKPPPFASRSAATRSQLPSIVPGIEMNVQIMRGLAGMMENFKSWFLPKPQNGYPQGELRVVPQPKASVDELKAAVAASQIDYRTMAGMLAPQISAAASAVQAATPISGKVPSAPTAFPELSQWKLPPFEPGSLNRALDGKVDAEVTKPVTAELTGQADVRVRIQVEGPGRVAGATATGSKHIAPRVGVDNTGAPGFGGPR